MMKKSVKNMTSVNDCISDMIEYVDVMIDNADVYYGDAGYAMRCTPSGDHVYAADDIYYIDMAVIKCIQIIKNHKKSK